MFTNAGRTARIEHRDDAEEEPVGEPRAAVTRTRAGTVEVATVGAAGPGPSVLVVHGMPGDYRQAQTVAEDLGGRTQVILVSRPGYGRTPLSSGRSPQQQAALYAALLDRLGTEQAVVVGISGGGPSSYAFAEQHPDRCAGLVLCCAVAAHLRQPPVGMRRLAAVPGVWSALAVVVRARARLGTPAPPDTSTLTPAERVLFDDPRVREPLQRFLAQSPTWLSGTGMRNDVRQLLAAVEAGPRPWPAGSRVPTVVLHGDTDDVVPLEHGQDLAARIPGARLEVLPGIGHGAPLFARERLSEVLHELVGRPAGRTAPAG